MSILAAMMVGVKLFLPYFLLNVCIEDLIWCNLNCNRVIFFQDGVDDGPDLLAEDQGKVRHV